MKRNGLNIGYLIISGNPQLTTVTITAPQGFTGSITISDNELLSTVVLDVSKWTSGQRQFETAGTDIQGKSGSTNEPCEKYE